MTRHPLIYLTWRSTLNRTRLRLRRLREPRYLIAFLLGAAYFSLVFIGGWRSDDSPSMLQTIARDRGGVDFGFALLMFGAAALAWIWPRAGRPALPFSRADVQHLFTAPLSRQELVRYRVLRSQLGALLGSAVVTLVFRPRSTGEGGVAFIGLLLLMATSSMHLTGVTLSRASRGLRAWLPRAAAASAVVVVLATIATHWGDLTAAIARGTDRSPLTIAISELDRLTSGGPASLVLWPFRTLARLPFASSQPEFLGTLPWVLLLLMLNYIWVVRTDAPFEEGSAELSEKLEELRRRGPRALRQPRAGKRTPFKLAPHGRPETAIVWKNLISMGRVLSWTVLVRVAPLIVFVAIMLSQDRSGDSGFLAFVCLFIAFMTLVIGPQLVRGDLRQDMTALDVLKTWPVRGAALVRGEILAPAIVLTTVIVLALIAAALLGPPLDGDAPNRWMLLLAALSVAPGLVLSQLLVQNGMAVAFPAWVRLGNRQGGFDAVGQQILVMIVVVLALAAAVVPAAAIAAIGAGILYLFTGTIPVLVPGVLAGGTLLAEAYAASEVIGAMLDRADLAAVDPSETA
ncbi:MAG: putative ABC exporter domain-containing protein [Vicinamibacterales bacterium]